MFNKYVFVLGAIVGILGTTSAVNENEKSALRDASLPLLEACGKEYGVTDENVMTARKTGNLDSIDPCFFACFFKKFGMLNSSGLFDLAAVTEQNKKFIHGDEDLKKVSAIWDTCISVNDQAVDDGDKGCARAKLLLSCLLKEKSDVLFTPFSPSA